MYRPPLLSLILITLLSVFLLGCCSRNPVEERDLLFFYLETCPSCEDYKMAESLSEIVKNLKGSTYNVANPENGAVLKTVLQEKELPDVSRSLPLLLIDDNFFNGYEEIQSELKKLNR